MISDSCTDHVLLHVRSFNPVRHLWWHQRQKRPRKLRYNICELLKAILQHCFKKTTLEDSLFKTINLYVYLDGQRIQIDLLKSLNLHVLNQATQLGDWNPLQKRTCLKKGCSI